MLLICRWLTASESITVFNDFTAFDTGASGTRYLDTAENINLTTSFASSFPLADLFSAN